MFGCGRRRCESCGEEMIHRDNRKPWESASALGQVVWRDGPRTFTVGDVDMYIRKWLGDRTILRLLEHKEPNAVVKAQQARALHDLDLVISHAIECPGSPIRLDASSGVYLVRGRIAGGRDSRGKVVMGPQEVGNQRLGKITIPTQEEIFAWLDGRAIGPDGRVA